MPRPEFAPIIARACAALVNALCLPLGARSRTYVRAMLAEDLAPFWTTQKKYGPIKFFCPGRWPYSRSDMGKEPNTYLWLETLRPGEVLWDVGANVGVYSLYAAAKGHTVCAFEAEASNFSVLVKNIDLNSFDSRITALNIAIGARTGMGRLAIGNPAIGGAQHRLHQDRDEGRAVIAYAGADIPKLLGLPEPHHIKIDVDGSELDVVRGLEPLLEGQTLRSVQIEIRDDTVEEMVAAFARHGFTPVPGHRTSGTRNIVFSRS